MVWRSSERSKRCRNAVPHAGDAINYFSDPLALDLLLAKQRANDGIQNKVFEVTKSSSFPSSFQPHEAGGQPR
ncbi:hypothetical protein PsorP6_015268 [Peronosclerospora sorghi]|uniref:Uncharacterized protein n=1 Tax=Peronosclerospora sorghi TaxID=230839 RepID=A0ACC0VRI7_9STRA|nr:hypothetical protein PsorP6_015268 [Peronosclerospora sorghi]